MAVHYTFRCVNYTSTWGPRHESSCIMYVCLSVWGTSTWDVWIAGAAPCRQDKLVGGDEPLLPLLVDAAQRVLVHKLRILIQIVD